MSSPSSSGSVARLEAGTAAVVSKDAGVGSSSGGGGSGGGGGGGGGDRTVLHEVDLSSSSASSGSAAAGWWRCHGDCAPALGPARARVRSAVETTGFHIVVVILVVVDCALVIAELLIDLDVFSDQAAAAATDGGGGDRGWLNGTTAAGHATSAASAEANGEGDNLAAAAHALHYCSIAILSVFMVETAAKVFAHGRAFVRRKLEVADALIVVVSFALDVAFARDEKVTSAFGLLVALRLWRVMRIVNGIIVSVKTQASSQVDKERSLRSEAQRELSLFAEFCAAQEREIAALRALLARHGIAAPRFDKPPIPRSTVNAAAEVNVYLASDILSTGGGGGGGGSGGGGGRASGDGGGAAVSGSRQPVLV